MPRLLPGYTYLGGSKRQYRSPTGEILSRRKYEDLLKVRSGSKWKSKSQYDRVRQTSRYQFFQGEVSAYHNIPINDLGPDSDFSQTYAAAVNSDWDVDAEGPYADLLVLIGRRRPEDNWDVGKTP